MKSKGRKAKLKKSVNKKQLNFLKMMNKLSSDEFKELAPLLQAKHINLICSLCSNVLFSKFGANIPKSKAKKLRMLTLPRKQKYLTLANRKAPLKQKRKIISQEGRGLGFLLSAAIPLISSLISSFTK